ncbi:hypothetical protein PInf_025713 [Phytophthora infestans]|nr:hypothetical protein PInf_025713 [Phytophthora infestans]
MAQASAEDVSEGREYFPVAEGASMRNKKKQVSRTAQQLASVLTALEDEEEASLALVATTPAYVTKAEEFNDLLADKFPKEIELVDRWKASKVKTFAQFWPPDELGKNAIGADMEGLCIFHALKRAAQLTGRPDTVTRKDIDDFVEHQRISRGEDFTKGASWKVVLVFLRRLRGSGRDFIYRAIALDNFAVPGRRGVRVLNEIKLKNGVYVVAAYSHQNVGHAFVLTVQGNGRLIYDLEEGKPLESAEDWIDFYACVRPFIVCKQK